MCFELCCLQIAWNVLHSPSIHPSKHSSTVCEWVSEFVHVNACMCVRITTNVWVCLYGTYMCICIQKFRSNHSLNHFCRRHKLKIMLKYIHLSIYLSICVKRDTHRERERNNGNTGAKYVGVCSRIHIMLHSNSFPFRHTLFCAIPLSCPALISVPLPRARPMLLPFFRHFPFFACVFHSSPFPIHILYHCKLLAAL